MANTIEIVIKTSADFKAISNVKKELGDLGSSAKGASGLLGGFGSALGGVATVAGGIVTANLFGKMAEGVKAFFATGLEAVGSAQQLETSLKALLTQNNMYEESVETTTQAITKQIMSAGDLAIKQDELAAKLATQRATYQEQQERIRQLTDAYGENGLNVIKAKSQHEQLALAIQKTERDIAGLTTSETTYQDVTKTVITQTMDQADAFKIAGEQTKELLDFISQVAVISPFETEDVEMTTKYAIAAGLGVDQTKEFVPAFLDLAGAVGITSSELGFAADQLFQVKKVGKLTTIDLRQLRRLGIDLGKVLGVEMGMSIEEFNAEAEKSPEIFDDLFEAVTRYSQNTFAGTSREMATSVKGLKSTLSDIFTIGARNFWRPIVDAATPMASEIIDTLSNFVLGGDIAALGQQMAEILMSGIGVAGEIFDIAKTMGIGAAIEKVVQMLQEAWPGIQATLFMWGTNFWNWITEIAIPAISESFTKITDAVAQWLADNWPAVSAKLVGWGYLFWDWLSDIVVPAISEKFMAITDAVAIWLAENWPTIQTQLATWGTNFWNWITETAIPIAGEQLGLLAAAITTWATEAWPTVQGTLATWGETFWEWTTVAAGFIQEKGGELLSQFVTWLMSGETQQSMNEIGALWGEKLAQGIEVLFSEQTTDLVTTLVQGFFTELIPALAIGIAGATAGLITIGANLVAGIAEGIINELTGGNFQADTVATMAATWQGIWENLKTIVSNIGVEMIWGIIQGIGEAQQDLNQVVYDTFVAMIDNFKELLGIASPSTVFSQFGTDILQGLIDGIRSMIGSLPEVLGEVGSTLLEAGSGLFAGLFGGGEGEGEASNPLAGILTSITTLQDAASTALPEAFTLFFEFLTEQITILIESVLLPFNQLWIDLYTIHFPTLQAVWLTVQAVMVSGLQILIAAMTEFTQQILAAQVAILDLGKISEKVFSDMADDTEDAANAIKNKLLPQLAEAIKRLERLQDRAESAYHAINQITGGQEAAVTGSSGIGFQHGTGSLGFLVPPGFPNDSFPINVTSGERVLVSPPGRSIEDIVAGRMSNTVINNNYYFSQTINTSAATTGIDDYRVGLSLIGA